MARRILLVGVILVVLAGCDWSMFRADAGHSGFGAFESKVSGGNVATLTQSWSAPTGGAVRSSPAVAAGVAYVGADDGKLYAFDAKGVTNCTATTCAPLWTATTGGAVSSSPAYDNGAVYVGSADGKLYAFDAKGATNCTAGTCTPLWTATTGGAITSSPAVANGVVYIGSADAKLYAFDAKGITNCTAGTCAPLWTATTGGAIASSPAVVGNTVAVGSDDATVGAFSADGTTNCTAGTCTPLWTATTGGAIASSPAIANGRVTIGSAAGTLTTYDAAGSTNCTAGACTPLWTATLRGAVASSPAVANNIVYVGADDGTVAAYSADGTTNCTSGTCTALWSVAIGSPVRSSPAVANGVLYVGANDNRLHVFQLPAVTTATAVTSSTNPSTFGGPVSFTATVTATNATPTGTVTFEDGAASLGTAPLTNGQATLGTSALAVGTHAITAVYAGTHEYAASTSPPLTQTVNPAGVVLYVDRNNPNCTNGGSGTASAPFCTISAGAQNASAGRTVQVAAGTYPEQVTVVSSGTSANPVTFTSAPNALVTVTGAAHGFVLSGRSWVTIHGFTVSGTSDHGIEVSGGSNLTIDGNRVTAAGSPSSGLTSFGIHTSGMTSSLVTNNTADHNSDAGIRVVSNSNNNTISGNEAFANARGYVRAAAGIDVRDSTGNLVFRNVSHDNEDSGINAWTGTANGQNTFFDNVTYGNGDHGIDVHNAVDAHVVANTVFGNVDSGIESTTSTRTYLANNVSVDNGINSPRTSGNIRIDAGSVGTAILNDDLVNLSVAGVMIDWNGTRYSSLAAFRAATGQESRGIEADPAFRNAGTADFRLLAGSRAIDSANSGASGQPSTDLDGNARVDDPATTNTGIGPIAYADRGAYEFQP